MTKSGARQFSSFLLAGLVAAAVNWLSRILFSVMGMTLEAAVVCAYAVGMATAYVLMRAFVFEKTDHGAKSEVPKFILVNILALAQVWLVTIGLDYWLPQIGLTWHPEAIAHGVGVASPTVTSYFGHRYLTFRQSRRHPETKPPTDPSLTARS